MATELEIERFCIGCGYNLRGIASHRCPECGLEVSAGAGSPVPWEGRKLMGWWRALNRTLWMGAFRVGEVAKARGVPANEGSALRFRLIVGALGAIPPSVLLWAAIISNGPGFLSVWNPNPNMWLPPDSPYLIYWELPVLWSAGATRWMVLPVGLFITLFLLSGLPGILLRGGDLPGELKERTRALSAYLSAPLVALAIPTLAVAISWRTYDPNGMNQLQINITANWATLITFPLIFILLFMNYLRFIRLVTHSGWGRMILPAIGMLVWWAIAVALGLIVFPVVWGLLCLMIDSLRP